MTVLDQTEEKTKLRLCDMCSFNLYLFNSLYLNMSHNDDLIRRWKALSDESSRVILTKWSSSNIQFEHSFLFAGRFKTQALGGIENLFMLGDQIMNVSFPVTVFNLKTKITKHMQNIKIWCL